MISKRQKKPGYGRLLDAWNKPNDAGDAIGCIVTSFTFSPVFFEEECLSRFLNMQTDPNEEGPLFIIEREEKLSGLQCAAALIDQHHCRGSRSLRWDMIPIRPKKGILHAKVSLLCWSQCIRLLIASANLTEDGYRRNQEIFGLIDFRDNGTAPLSCLTETIQFLQDIMREVNIAQESFSPSNERIKTFLDATRLRVTKEWKITDSNSMRSSIKIYPVFTKAGKDTVLQQIKKLWPDGLPPKDAFITSPFFDLPESVNKPAKEIWSLLNQRGEASVTYNVKVEEQTPKGNAYFIYAPESLKTAKPLNRSQIGLNFVALHERDDAQHRPLHLKSIWIENDRTAGYMIGSSNFTSPGLGLAENANLEANLIYFINYSRNKSLYNALGEGYLDGDDIDMTDEHKWIIPTDLDEDSPESQTILLPSCFGDAIYDMDENGKQTIELFINATPPNGWTIMPDTEQEVFFDENKWRAIGLPLGSINIPCPESNPPSGFEVRWQESKSCAWWPVIIKTANALPPPNELKDLPLEVLINILTSARPLHEVMKKYLNKESRRENGEEGPLIDPHKRVDTSSFMLQRTRKVSLALTELRKRLQKPAPTLETLSWRLSGPVGVIALSNAIIKEAKSEQEKAFLIAELIIELARVKPEKNNVCVSPMVIKTEVQKIIRELCDKVSAEVLNEFPNLKKYVEDVFLEVLK